MTPARAMGQGIRPGFLPALLLALGLWLGAALPAGADYAFPALTGRVVDAAGILSPQARAALEAKLAAQEAKTSDQFVVATVPTLEGTSVEDYANRLFRFWKLGQGDKNNGVLLLVAPNDRRVRIEVGYGLEGVLPDAVASTIIGTAIVPAFRSGDFAGGVEKGADAVIEILNLDPEEAKRRAAQADDGNALTADDWFNLIFFLVMLAFWLYIFYRAVRSGGGGGPRMTRGRRGGAVVLPGGISTWDWPRGGSGGGWSGGSGGGGFSGGGGSSGGGGASGSW